jgi:2'-5' RNA ligase
MQHIAKMREGLPEDQTSWSREESVHLTLKFLGEIPIASVPTFSQAVSRAVAGIRSFPIVVEGAGIFPNSRRPRVLWVGISDPSGSLNDLHSQLDFESVRSGFPKEVRPFHPHITLARLRDSRHSRVIVQAHQRLLFTPEAFTATELLVIRSELNTCGSKYSVVSRHPLRERDRT